MYTDFLIDAKTFVKVIKLGSISALSQRDGEHRTTISKRIARIEEYFSVKLIKIDKGKLKLTKEGESSFAIIKRIIKDLEFKFDELLQVSNHSKHNVSFLTNTDISTSFGTSLISEILPNNPLLSIEAKVYTQYQLKNYGTIIKHALEDIDITILWEDFLHLIDDQKWIIKGRFSTKKNIYASTKYIEKNQQVIENILDISKHTCIANKYEEHLYWPLQDQHNNEHKIKVNVRAAVETFNFQLKLIENHIGIGLLPESIVKANSVNLRQIFPNYSTKPRTSCLLINKCSLKNKPIIKNIAEKINETASFLNYWT